MSPGRRIQSILRLRKSLAGESKRAGFCGALAAAIAMSISMMNAGSAAAPSAADSTLDHGDYSDPALWLCRPDLKENHCNVNLDATVIAANGETSLEEYSPAENPGFDCFFVYPTVSKDPGWQSDFTPDHMEIEDIRLQFARFGEACRQFAPMYRQHTVTALRRNAGGPQPVGERPAPGFGGYTDVLDAWRWYLENENGGRGVVLIGHSQGAAMLSRLLAEEIEGKPRQRNLISALIIGAPVFTPPGKDFGGSLKSIPLCRAEDQVGCVITYATYRASSPPPENALFGRSRDGLRVACVNPANLQGGVGVATSYFLTKGFLNDAGGTVQPAWTSIQQDIQTPFVKTPGLVSTRCVSEGEFTYLELREIPNPNGGRTDKIAGEIVRPFGIDPVWGLHLIDMEHSMGDLIRIITKQAKAYEANK